MKKLAVFILLAALAYGYMQEQGALFPSSASTTSGYSSLQDAFSNKQSDLQVQGEGVVVSVLRDDLEGSKHQKFILELSSGQTVLVSHNIDLAPRIDDLSPGDAVEFFGEYEWNPKGGVIHWTHHDPAGRHVAGWLKHGGRTYQ